MSRAPYDDDPTLVPPGAPGGDEAFPLVLRGYDRQAVDAHIAELRRQIDELAAVRSPEAAVQRALDRIGAETAGILQEAHRTADELTGRSRAKADDRVQQAEREAIERSAAAEARIHELDRDADLIWQERQRLIEDTRRLADTLLRVADEAAERFPAEELPVDEALTERSEPAADPTAAPPEAAPAEPVDEELARAELAGQATVAMDPAELEHAMREDEVSPERPGEAA